MNVQVSVQRTNRAQHGNGGPRINRTDISMQQRVHSDTEYVPQQSTHLQLYGNEIQARNVRRHSGITRNVGRARCNLYRSDGGLFMEADVK